jgi:hypothetical protein
VGHNRSILFTLSLVISLQALTVIYRDLSYPASLLNKSVNLIYSFAVPHRKTSWWVWMLQYRCHLIFLLSTDDTMHTIQNAVQHQLYTVVENWNQKQARSHVIDSSSFPVTLKSRSSWFFGCCLYQMYKSCTGENMMYSQADCVLVLEYYATLKLFATVNEVFGNVLWQGSTTWRYTDILCPS